MSLTVAAAALACSVVAPDEGFLTDGHCGALEKVCERACVSTSNPAVGCATTSCAPCELPHAVPGCSDGRCGVAACELGFGDCNGIASDGCETDLRSDEAHCGECNHVCGLATATSACKAGQCVATGCLPGRADCDGSPKTVCETSISDDPKHCGGCGAACALPHVAEPSCLQGACQVLTCEPGYADCDGVASDGCEVDVESDSENCGKCAVACSADKLCSEGACVGRCSAVRSVYPEAHLTIAPQGFGVVDGDFTVEAWLFLSSLDPSRKVVMRGNDDYSVNGLSFTASIDGTSCVLLNPKGLSPGAGTGHAVGPTPPVDSWFHLACVRADNQLMLFLDGKLVNAAPVATDLLALSPTALFASSALVGPIRFSKAKRYSGPFTPRADWPVDADTVAQFLTQQAFFPLAQVALIDEAGGDNTGKHWGGFVPDLAGVACGK